MTDTTRTLSDATLPLLKAGVARPRYDRRAAGIGVVHFGPGAFHRAHQAYYFDELLNRGSGDWAVSAVSLRSGGVTDALAPQDGLYTLAELDERVSFRVVGALTELLSASRSPEAVLSRLAHPATRVVTMTVTEKGYCLGADGELDLSHPDVALDLERPYAPVSVPGCLVEALKRRRAAGLRPFTAISCDNLVDNGRKLGAAVVALARESDPDLARWIEAEGAFPSTMVDSITPATDDPLRARVAEATGLSDAWPIQRESFTQWVVEDRFADLRPALDEVGVTFTSDVRAFDRAKLRLLNGPHSSLAYLGSLMGLETVRQAMEEPALAGFVERLVRDDILPTVTAPAGFDLGTYVADILRRFRNPAIRHLLSQIAWDGSQKLPFRLMGTVADALAAGRPVDRLCLPLAAWMHFVRRAAAEGRPITDPMADRLLGIGRACGGAPSSDVARFLDLGTVFPAATAAAPRFRDALTAAYAALGTGSPADVRRALGG